MGRANASKIMAVIAAGACTVAGIAQPYVRWNTDLGLAGPTASFPGRSVNAIVEFDGQLVAAGNFPFSGSDGIVVFDGGVWDVFPGGGVSLSGPSSVPTILDMVSFVEGGVEKLMIVGFFDHAGTVAVNGIAVWDGSDWTARETGLPSFVTGQEIRSLTLYPDGNDVYRPVICGSFPSDTCQASAIDRLDRVYRWDPSGGGQWQPMGQYLMGTAYWARTVKKGSGNTPQLILACYGDDESMCGGAMTWAGMSYYDDGTDKFLGWEEESACSSEPGPGIGGQYAPAVGDAFFAPRGVDPGDGGRLFIGGQHLLVGGCDTLVSIREGIDTLFENDPDGTCDDITPLAPTIGFVTCGIPVLPPSGFTQVEHIFVGGTAGSVQYATFDSMNETWCWKKLICGMNSGAIQRMLVRELGGGDREIVVVGAFAGINDANRDAFGVATLKWTNCKPDLNADGFTDAVDYDLFITSWVALADCLGDYNEDGFVDAIDYDNFIDEWTLGC